MHKGLSALFRIKTIVVLLLFYILIQTNASAQSWQWAKTAGGSNSDHAVSIAKDNFGYIYVAGYYSSSSATFGTISLPNSGSNDVFLAKYDTLGNLIWVQKAGSTGSDQPTSVAVDIWGNIYLSGFFESSTITFGSFTLYNNGTRNAFLVKYNSLGNVIWARQAGGVSVDAAYSVTTDKAGNIYETGTFSSPAITFGTTVYFNSSTDGTDNMFVAKYDSSGIVVWAAQGMGNDIVANSITVDSKCNIYACGYFNNPTMLFGLHTITNLGNNDIYIVKYDSSGHVKWAKSAGGIGNDQANSISVDAYGHVYLAGLFYSLSMVMGTTGLTNLGASDMFLAQYDTLGNVGWAVSAGGVDTDVATSVYADTAGNSYLTGVFKSSTISLGTSTLTNAGGIDMFLSKYTIAGSVVYAKRAGGTGNDIANDVISDNNQNVYLTGYYSSPEISFSTTLLTNTGIDNIFISKLNDTITRPDIIIGISTICMGSTSTLADGVGGGTWSSSNTLIATVGTTGIVTGVSSGIDTISYTIGSYSASVIFTVDSMPIVTAITGTSAVCMYSSITLTETCTTGVWSASNTNASISFTGVVTGVSAGVDTINYIDSNSCGLASTSKVITINTSPVVDPITGLSAVCLGSSIILSSTTTGGTWHSSNTHASIFGSCIVHGVSSGVDTISYYKYNSVCTTTAIKIITVDVTPVAGIIIGPSSICVGVSDTYTDTITIGTWGSLTPTKLSISSLGLATGLLGGVATIGYSVSNSCGGVTTTKAVTVLPLSNPGVILGQDSLCIGSSITLTDSVPGGVWGIQNSLATLSGSIVTGVAAGTDTVSYSTTNSCGTEFTLKIITISDSPIVAPIVGDSGLCYGEVITLTDAIAGGTWLTTNAIVTNSAGIITGVGLGVDTVIYSIHNACGTATATRPVTVSLIPTAGIIVGPDSICTGVIVTYSSTSPGGIWSNTFTGTIYVTDSAVAGLSPGVDSIYYTVTNSCSFAVTYKTITVLPLPTAGIIIGPDSVCLLSNITLVATAVGGEWSVTNTNASVSSGIVTGNSLGFDTILYSVTNSCGTEHSSKEIYVKPFPTVAPITGNDSLCIYSSSLTLYDSTMFGVWSVANNKASINDSGIVTGLHAGIDTVIYTFTNNCGSITATKTITVEPMPNPGVISGIDSICIGGYTVLSETVPGGVWNNLADSIATFSHDTVLGHSVGIDSIVYTVTNICGSTHTKYAITVLTTESASIVGRSFTCIDGLRDTLQGLPAGGTWSILNSNVAITDLGSDGELITGVSKGQDTIIYSVTNFCGTTKDTIALEINQIVQPTITGIDIICYGKSDTFTGTPAGGIWFSSNPFDTITTIPEGGVIFGEYLGVDTVSYSISNICGIGTFKITVTIHTKLWCDSVYGGIEKLYEHENDVILYPNPNTGLFIVSLPESGFAKISIYDLFGNEVLNRYNSTPTNLLNIEMNDMLSGVYFVKIEFNNTIYRKKIVVNR